MSDDIGSKRLIRPAEYFTLATIVGVAMVAWTLFLFAHPVYDDFRLSSQVLGQGWYDYTVDTYLHFSGRWSTYLLISIVFSYVDPIRFYPWLLAALSGLQLLCLYAGGRAFLGNHVSRKAAVLVAVAAFALLYAGRPSPEQTVYWFCGAVPYQLSVSLSIFLVAFLSQPPGKLIHGRMPVRVTIGVLLALLTTGLNELVSFMLCVVLLAGTAIAFRAARSNRFAWAIVLGAAAVGFLIVSLAPGNSIRQADISGSGLIGISLKRAIRDIVRFGEDWILDPKLLIATLLIAIDPRLSKVHPSWLDWPGIPWKWIVPGTLIFVLFAGFAMMHWAAGDWMPGRVIDSFYAVFLLGWFTSVFVWTRQPADARTRFRLLQRLAVPAMMVMLSLVLIGTGSARLAIMDLMHGTARQWSGALTARYEAIRRAKRAGIQDVIVPQPPPRPTLFLGRDITEDPRSLRNTSVADYFRIRSIAVEPRLTIDPLND